MRGTTHRGWFGRIGIFLAGLALAACAPVFGKPDSAAAVLTWTPPTTTTRGTPLTDLAGFDVFGGLNPQALRLIAHVKANWVGRCKITGLTAGTWYFVVTSYTIDGTESAPSNFVSTTIPGLGVFAGNGRGPLRWICRAPPRGPHHAPDTRSDAIKARKFN